jgi:hypothetical protein
MHKRSGPGPGNGRCLALPRAASRCLALPRAARPPHQCSETNFQAFLAALSAASRALKYDFMCPRRRMSVVTQWKEPPNSNTLRNGSVIVSKPASGQQACQCRPSPCVGSCVAARAPRRRLPAVTGGCAVTDKYPYTWGARQRRAGDRGSSTEHALRKTTSRTL